jgi:predicted ester cyclase
MDRAGHHNLALAFYGAFPDLHQTIEESVADGNAVALSFRATGTHTGDFMGMPATGKPIDVAGIEDGKIASLKEIFDAQTLMEQIGAAPG